MNKELEQYQVQPEPMWDRLCLFGGDGYDVIEQASRRRWEAIPAWGERGWDLGSWPLVIIFHKDNPGMGRYFVVEYVEGDLTCWDCPTPEIREQITDSIAFYHWEFQEEEWVAPYENETQAPAALRGPYSEKRISA
jgi:hypothetical protein